MAPPLSQSKLPFLMLITRTFFDVINAILTDITTFKGYIIVNVPA